jgi:hypothetical protein
VKARTNSIVSQLLAAGAALGLGFVPPAQACMTSKEPNCVSPRLTMALGRGEIGFDARAWGRASSGHSQTSLTLV